MFNFFRRSFQDKGRHTCLLITFFLFFLIYPFVQRLLPRLATLSELFVLTVFMAVAYSVMVNRRVFIAALCLLVAGIAGTAAAHLTSSNALLLVGTLASIGFLLLTIIFILKEVLSQDEVNFNCISGALNGYLLLGILWGLLYQVLELIWPGSFIYSNQSLLNAGSAGYFRDMKELFYFSFVTLTTLGYGDVSPAGGPATSLATLEAVLGQFYMVVLVARLVALHTKR